MNTLNAVYEKFQLARRQVADAKLELREAKRSVRAHATALQVVKDIVQQIQEKTHGQIAAMVTRCLAAVFDEPYVFHIVLEQKRGKTEARIVFERDGVQVDPLSASGGGMVDVAAFALRLACIMLSKPPVRRIMFLDEPFKFVAREALPRVRQLIEQLAAELDFQFVIVTHLDLLETGQIVELV